NTKTLLSDPSPSAWYASCLPRLLTYLVGGGTSMLSEAYENRHPSDRRNGWPRRTVRRPRDRGILRAIRGRTTVAAEEREGHGPRALRLDAAVRGSRGRPVTPFVHVVFATLGEALAAGRLNPQDSLTFLQLAAALHEGHADSWGE